MNKSAKAPDLSIVIPAYQEEKRIGGSMEKLAKFLSVDPFFMDKAIEVIVVSADSSDKSHEIIRAKGGLFKNFLFLTPGERVGKGRDVRFGMLRASGKAVVFMDADLSTPIKHLEEFYRQFEAGSEVIIATRSIRKYRGTVLRSSLSFMGNILFTLLGGIWVEDSQCGFKMFSKHASDLCFNKLRIMEWGFDMEILAIARSNHLKIKTIRVEDWDHVSGGSFDNAVIKNTVKSLSDLVLIFSRRISGSYRQESEANN